MARKKRGRPIDGWLILDKPLGMTSTQAVARVRRILDARKLGHGGTLDPLATGLLPIALGEATKTVSHAMDGRKSYRFTLRWGEATTTDDAEGEVQEVSDLRPTRAEIEAALPRFLGEIEQIPPAFSAIKIEGERAYDLARQGEAPEMPKRVVRIDALRLLEMPDADHAVFHCDCGKGTYVRALARDLARALGTCGHLVALRRTRVGPFAEEDMISLDSLETLGHSAAALERLLPVEAALDDIPAFVLTEIEANRLRQGQSVSLLKRSNLARLQEMTSGTLVFARTPQRAVALARFEAGDLHPVRVLNT